MAKLRPEISFVIGSLCVVFIFWGGMTTWSNTRRSAEELSTINSVEQGKIEKCLGQKGKPVYAENGNVFCSFEK